MPPFTPDNGELLHLLGNDQALIVRAVDPQPTADGGPEMSKYPTEWFWWNAGEPTASIVCPFGEPGIVLWGREAIRCNAEHNNFYYAIDSRGVGEWNYHRLRAHGGIGRDYTAEEMGREVTRLWLRVASVDCRRVATITQDEAELTSWVPKVPELDPPWLPTHYFACQWNDANRSGEKFADDPWAWFVHVEKIRPPVALVGQPVGVMTKDDLDSR